MQKNNVNHETTVRTAPIEILEPGLTSLEQTDRLIQSLMELRRVDEVSDTVLLTSHEPCLTVGARELNPDDMLRPLEEFEKEGIKLIKTIRGGGLTYHWPGQINFYPILKLNPEERNVSEYMSKLEEVVLRTLKSFGIDAYRRRDEAAQIGLWYDGQKIASMGVHVSRWITGYGFALNVTGDLSPSRYIRPCGLDNVRLTTMALVLDHEPDSLTIKRELLRQFAVVFKRRLSDYGFNPRSITRHIGIKESARAF
ncbi:lipoyl(octanoyl) transferase LipB [candidate division KSB1 bacterium]|nr:lipoyl(octanoyl) transferase LipB [candidate division KSB1 bacterium]